MPVSPRRYTAAQLGQLTGLTERTVRYYVKERLIDPPSGRGRGAHFDDSHLSQLRRVRLLQEAGLDHTAIRQYGADIEAALAKRGLSRKDWDKSMAGHNSEIVLAYHRLTAKKFQPELTSVTRVTVAPGIQLLVDRSRHLPPPARLADAIGHLRSAFGVGDEPDPVRITGARSADE